MERWKNLTASGVVFLGLALAVFLALSGSAGAARPQAIISPTSNFVLYSREDKTIWIKTLNDHVQLLAGVRPRLSSDGHYLAYQAERNGDIYVRDLQTNSDTLVYSHSSTVVNIDWAADDSRIYFDSGCSIYTIKPDGSDQQQVIGQWPASNYCYNDSPSVNLVDGRIAWENEKYGLGVAQGDGQNPAWVPNTVPYDYTPAWSPDGIWIAFWRDDNIFKIKPDGSELTQLSFLAGDSDNWLNDVGAWTADGSWLVTAGKIGGVDGLYAFASNGSGETVTVLLRDGASLDFVSSAGTLAVYPLYLPFLGQAYAP